MKIILDTNIFFETKQRLLRSPEITFIHEHESFGWHFVVPELVRDEVVNKYRENYEERERELRKKERELRALLLDADALNVFCKFSPDEATENYRKALELRMDELQIRRPPYPEIPHEKLVARCLQRRKPFGGTGSGNARRDTGYRDAILWESVLLEIVADEEVVFVTRNHKDFGDGNGNLHRDLKEDLSNRGHSPNAVRMCDSLPALCRNIVYPTMEKQLGKLREQLEESRAQLLISKLESDTWTQWNDLHVEVTQAVSDRLKVVLLEGDGGISEMIGIPINYPRLETLSIYPDHREHLRTVLDAVGLCVKLRPLDDERTCISFQQTGLANVEFLVDQHDARRTFGGDDNVDIDWSSDMTAVWLELEICYEISCVVDYNLQLLEWNISSVRFVGRRR